MTDLRVQALASLDALDRVLASQPDRDGTAFTDATESLCRVRTLMIAQCRNGSGRHAHLDQLNAIISGVMAGHYPVANVPWPLLQSARAALDEMLANFP